MQYTVEICKGCGRKRLIVNRTRMLCDRCNQERLHGCSREERYSKKQRVKKSKTSSGELALFKEIWSEREHICCKCGRVLLEPMRVHYFSHIHSKGARPDLRLNKDNIELLCMECHHKYEFGSRNG